MNTVFFVTVYGGPLDGLEMTIPVRTLQKLLREGGEVEFEYEGAGGRYRLAPEEALVIYLGPAVSL